MDERRRPERVVVVGAGVSGLTCGITLLREGIPVTLVAAGFWDDRPRKRRNGYPPAPCSPWAAAIWYPYHCEPMDRVNRWSAETLAALAEIAANPESGVRMVPFDVFMGPRTEVEERPRIAFLRPEVPPRPLPSGCVAGARIRVPLMDTSRYLRFLAEWFRSLGGTTERRRLESLEPLRSPGTTVVNCSGLGARALTPEPDPDPEARGMVGARGQVLRVRLRSPLEQWSVALRDDEPPVYVIPRGEDFVLGGTYEEGIEDELIPPDGEDGAPLPAEERIIRECALLEPALADQLPFDVVRRGAGLRPVRRDGIRLERERAPGRGDLVHNYGHGGAGFTVAWGCAAEVARLVLEPGDEATGGYSSTPDRAGS